MNTWCCDRICAIHRARLSAIALLISLALLATHIQATTRLPSLFLTGQWLEQHLHDPEIRIVQVGGSSSYEDGHIPGATFLSYEELITERDGVQGMRADSEQLATTFSRLGINAETSVVAYDTEGGMDASRLIWTLASLGHFNGGVLDGGLDSWLDEKRPIRQKKTAYVVAKFNAIYDDEWEATWSRVENISLKKAPGILLDVRSKREYIGLTWMSPRGHIPGAIHREWSAFFRSTEDARLQERDAILENLAALGVTKKKNVEIIVYCAVGQRASHSWLLLRHLGFRNVRLFDGSIIEWGELDLPTIMGSTP